MKILYQHKNFTVYQCEKCGCRQKLPNNITPKSCIAVDCDNYGYGKDEYSNKLTHLRKKYIGARIKEESAWIVADFLDLDTVVILDLAGYYPIPLPISMFNMDDDSSHHHSQLTPVFPQQ